MVSASPTTNAQPEYLVLQFSYTTAQVEESRFSGETPDCLYFALSQQPSESEEELPLVLTVIDSELRVVRDETPPGARSPASSSLFELVNEPELMV